MQQIPIIPFDILDRIVDTLADGDEPNFKHLRACSLANHALLHSSRKHIFRTLVIDCVAVLSDVKIPFLSGLVTASPILAGYTRNLTLYIDDRLELYMVNVAPILKHFTNIQSLEFGGRDNGRGWLAAWDKIPVDHTHINDLLKLDSLTSLVLQAATVPLSKLSLGANLKKLHVNMLQASKDNDGPLQVVGNPIQLLDYTVTQIDDAVANALLEAQCPNKQPMIDFSRLYSLTAACHFRESELATAILFLRKTSCLSVIHLKVGAMVSSLKTIFEVLLHSASTLKKIVINHSTYYFSMPLIFSLASELAVFHRNVLEEIDICITLFLAPVGTLGDEWSKLDTVLTEEDKWPYLKTVSIKIKTHSSSKTLNIRDFHGDTQDFSQRRFPLLSSSRTVLFRFGLELISL